MFCLTTVKYLGSLRRVKVIQGHIRSLGSSYKDIYRRHEGGVSYRVSCRDFVRYIGLRILPQQNPKPLNAWLNMSWPSGWFSGEVIGVGLGFRV